MPRGKYCVSLSLVRAGGLPDGFADVETMGPPSSRQMAWTTGCADTRSATVSWRPRIHSGALPLSGTRKVTGPGQASARTAVCSFDKPSRYGANCPMSAAARISPASQGRCFNARIRDTASGSSGTHPSPQTPSVG